MADWGVVGICAAGGALVAPVFDHAARTVRRPVTAAAGAADAAPGAPVGLEPGAAARPSGTTRSSGTALLTTAAGASTAATVGPAGATADVPAPPAGAGADLPALPAATTADLPAGAGAGLPALPVVPAEMAGAVLATAGLLALAAGRVGAVPVLGAYAALMAALVCLSVVDLRTGLLPRRFVYPAAVTVAVGLVSASAVSGDWHRLFEAAVGGAAALVVFGAIWWVFPRGMGFGDVRLAGLCGMALGWLGYRQLYLGFLAAFVIGSVVGVGYLAVTGSRRFPFGPALAAGCAFGVLWGGWLGNLWLHTG